MNIKNTLYGLVLGASLMTGCSDMGKCRDIPVVDEFSQYPIYRVTVCEKEDGSSDHYRNGRLMYTLDKNGRMR